MDLMHTHTNHNESNAFREIVELQLDEQMYHHNRYTCNESQKENSQLLKNLASFILITKKNQNEEN